MANQSHRTRRPTIADVARLAGVNKSSVSRVLNLAPGEYNLSPATRERILRAVKELGYRANWQAKAFQQGRTQIVGIAFGQYLPAMYGVNELIIRACAAKLMAGGYHLVLIPGIDDADDLVMERRIDGCIVAEELSPQFRDLLIKEQMPTVLINVDSDADIPQVLADDRTGCRLAMEHLLGLGHRKIAFYMRPRVNQAHYSTRDRVGVYQQMMTGAGLQDLILVDRNEPADFVASARPGRGGPTAIVVHSHPDAIELLHALWRQGIRVPQDLSIVSFNDVFPTEFITPPLTSVSVPATDMGHRAIDLLFKGMNPDESDAPVAAERLRLAEHLVVRESTAPAPQA